MVKGISLYVQKQLWSVGEGVKKNTTDMLHSFIKADTEIIENRHEKYISNLNYDAPNHSYAYKCCLNLFKDSLLNWIMPNVYAKLRHFVSNYYDTDSYLQNLEKN